MLLLLYIANASKSKDFLLQNVFKLIGRFFIGVYDCSFFMSEKYNKNHIFLFKLGAYASQILLVKLLPELLICCLIFFPFCTYGLYKATNVPMVLPNLRTVYSTACFSLKNQYKFRYTYKRFTNVYIQEIMDFDITDLFLLLEC